MNAKNDPAAEFEAEAAHDAMLAMTPGWWQFTRAKVVAMEANDEAQQQWQGLRAAVALRIREAGFKPAAHELLEIAA